MSHVITKWETGSASHTDFNAITEIIREAGGYGWEVKGFSTFAAPTTEINDGVRTDVWKPTYFVLLQRPVKTADAARRWEF